MTPSLDLLTLDTRVLAVKFLVAAKAAGLDVVLGSTLRTCAQQGLSTAPVVVQGMSLKRAPGCRSWHVWGRAFDVTLVQPSADRYAQLGALGKSLGLQWGGDFVSNPDPIHFQNPAGLNINTLCPDPMKCDEAVAAAKVVPSVPVFEAKWPAFFVGLSLGFVVSSVILRS